MRIFPYELDIAQLYFGYMQIELHRAWVRQKHRTKDNIFYNLYKIHAGLSLKRNALYIYFRPLRE